MFKTSIQRITKFLENLLIPAEWNCQIKSILILLCIKPLYASIFIIYPLCGTGWIGAWTGGGGGRWIGADLACFGGWYGAATPE